MIVGVREGHSFKYMVPHKGAFRGSIEVASVIERPVQAIGK